MSNETPQQPTPANELLEALGTTLSPDLLVQALTHRSFSHEHPGVANYERLEFLGDAVLELVSTETLFTIHPDMTEGQLAKMRAKAVSEDALSAIAKTKLKVGPYILLGHGEAEQGGAEKNSILCDIVESLIGATFLEHGIDEARKVIHRLIDDTLAEVATEGPALDWKTSLTVKAHGLGKEEPVYHMEVSGPEYAQIFTARVSLGENGDIIGKALQRYMDTGSEATFSTWLTTGSGMASGTVEEILAQYTDSLLNLTERLYANWESSGTSLTFPVWLDSQQVTMESLSENAEEPEAEPDDTQTSEAPEDVPDGQESEGQVSGNSIWEIIGTAVRENPIIVWSIVAVVAALVIVGAVRRYHKVKRDERDDAASKK